MGKQQVIYGNTFKSLGTLGAEAALSDDTKIDAARAQGCRIKQLKAVMHYYGKTDANGPVIVGFATGLTSDAEIAEAFKADPVGSNDVPATEHSNRKIFPIWVIPITGPAESGVDNDSLMLKEVHFPWKEIPEGVALKMFVFNEGAGAMDTGMSVGVFYAAVTEWLLD